MGKVLNVLYGFKHRTTENAVTNCLESYGYKVQSKTRYSKATIKDFLSKTEEIDVVFLKEFLEGGERYSALEISELSDNSRANFIAVVRPQHKGHDSMKTLYAAGILNAVFADQRMGVKPEILANLALKGRTHLEARTYYKIDSPLPDYGLLSYEDFRDNYAYFSREIPSGAKKIDRFIDVTRALSPIQLGKFIENLQEADIEYLSEYEDYYDVLEELYAQGAYPEKVRRPKGGLKRAVEKGDAEKVFSGQAFIVQPDILPVLEPVQIDLSEAYGVDGDDGDVPEQYAGETRGSRRGRISPEQRKAKMSAAQHEITIRGVPDTVPADAQGTALPQDGYANDGYVPQEEEQYGDEGYGNDAGYEDGGYVDEADGSYMDDGGDGYVDGSGYPDGADGQQDDGYPYGQQDDGNNGHSGKYIKLYTGDDREDFGDDLQPNAENGADSDFADDEPASDGSGLDADFGKNTTDSGLQNISSQHIEKDIQNGGTGSNSVSANAAISSPRRKRRSEMTVEELAKKYQ